MSAGSVGMPASFAARQRRVLGQVKVAEKSNEIIANAPGKTSLRLKRKAAGWDDEFLVSLLAP